MSGSNGRNSRETFQDGVTVRQTFSEDEFGVPAVRIDLDSDLDHAVRVELDVTLPESESVDRVGFHPEYDPDNWSIEANTLSYRRRLSPGADVTTVYAVQDLASDTGSALLENLTVAGVTAIDEAEPDADADEGAAEAIERDEGAEPDVAVGAPAAGAEPAGEDDPLDPVDAADSRSAPGDAEPGATDVTTAGEAADGRDEASADTGDASVAADIGAQPDDRLVDELLRRLDAGELDAEPHQRLRDRLGAGDADALDQRIADLQRRVSDIEAFSSSVESVHEAHGPPAEVIAETKADLADLAEQIDGLDDRVDALDAEGADIVSRIEGVEADVAALEAELAEVEDRLDAAADDRAELESSVEDLLEWRQQFVGSLTDLGGE